MKIALAGNPNTGKTTLFNALTGLNQYIGNWPGVTVEKKIGKLKKDTNIEVVDLPGVYSLSPYSPEEGIARDFLVNGKPDVIINIIDSTNIERNLYLTSQFLELGIPVVLALNMVDVLNKSGIEINSKKLSDIIGCPVIEITALKNQGIDEVVEEAIKEGKKNKNIKRFIFNSSIENVLSNIEKIIPEDISDEQRDFYTIKIFEKDLKVLEQLDLDQEKLKDINNQIKEVEEKYDDDSESLIIDGRYSYIEKIIPEFVKKTKHIETPSEKIDKIVTNRILGLPIFILVMFSVYFISVTTVGSWVTDFVNEGVFGDGFFLFSKGRTEYEEALENYELAQDIILTYEMDNPEDINKKVTVRFINEDGEEEEFYVDYRDYREALEVEDPDPDTFGTFIPGIPVLLKEWLVSVDCALWLQELLLDGIVSGVGAVLGFVPQIFVLFFLLAFLESCGYMARVAFILDRLFRKFGLSGKSFIPMLIGTGCGVPGIMASRTIENEANRRMTIITTTFIPCSAKLPVIALISGALFAGVWWVAPSAYLIGAFSIIASGIMLKKTKPFRSEETPFVMELPAYHWPRLSSLLNSTWERGWSFIKKAGTIILLATIIIWLLSNFGFANGKLQMVSMNDSILAMLGQGLSVLFAPLGWGNWQATVAALTGLIAKENIVGTFGVLFGGFNESAESGWQVWSNLQGIFSPLAGFSFLIFNLLCAPCFAAIGAIRREMNSWKWTLFAVAYQCGFAYAISLIIYQIGSWFYGGGNVYGTILAIFIILFLLYMLFKPVKKDAYIPNINVT